MSSIPQSHHKHLSCLRIFSAAFIPLLGTWYSSCRLSGDRMGPFSTSGARELCEALWGPVCLDIPSLGISSRVLLPPRLPAWIAGHRSPLLSDPTFCSYTRVSSLQAGIMSNAPLYFSASHRDWQTKRPSINACWTNDSHLPSCEALPTFSCCVWSIYIAYPIFTRYIIGWKTWILDHECPLLCTSQLKATAVFQEYSCSVPEG